jgi:hypothetical protein
MTKKVMKGADGKYTVHGKKYQVLIGSRAQVWHGTAYKTAGGLTKNDLHMNKNGRIVSKKKHQTAKKEKRLEKHGFFAKKGKFGAVKKTARKSRSRRSKTGRK